MPRYRYNVINPENKALTGTISAPDEQSARAELNQLGFSIISISPATEEDAAPTAEEKQMAKFDFAAIDKNQKRVIGTIQAEDRYSAFKRLIKEYLFEVEYLVDESLPEDQKNTEKQKGVFELQNQFDVEAFTAQKKQQGETAEIKEFEKRQEALQSQVDFVLKKVKEMLDLYESEIRPDVKEKIRKMVDKILRIKSSTNLDYVRTSCEELLTFLQKEELFLHENSRLRERTKMALDAKSMMMQLHRSKTKTFTNLHEALVKWREEHILGNEKPTILEKLENFFIGAIIGFAEESPEIAEIRHNIAIVNQQIMQYILLYFQSATPEFKNEAKISIKKLFQERKKLRSELKMAKREIKEQRRKKAEATTMEKLGNELLSFSGWLLTFYLIYYFVSIYLNTKQFGLAPMPFVMNIYKSSFLKYFLTVLFLFHSSLSVKINFFRRNEVATLIITPIFLLSSIIMLLNF